jgi:hypothetical protein
MDRDIATNSATVLQLLLEMTRDQIRAARCSDRHMHMEIDSWRVCVSENDGCLDSKSATGQLGKEQRQVQAELYCCLP